MKNKKCKLNKKMLSITLSLMMTSSAVAPSFAIKNSDGVDNSVFSMQSNNQETEITEKTKQELNKLIDEMLNNKELVHRYIGTPFIRTTDNGTPFDVYSDRNKLTKEAVEATSWYLVWQLAQHHKNNVDNYTEDQAKNAINELYQYKKAYCFDLGNELKKDGFYETTTGNFKIFNLKNLGQFNPAQDLFEKTEENNELKELFGSTVQIYKSGNNIEMIMSANTDKVKEIKSLSVNGVASINPKVEILRPSADNHTPLFYVTIPGEIKGNQLVITNFKYVDENNQEHTLNTPFGIEMDYSKFIFQNDNPQRRKGEGSNRIKEWINRGNDYVNSHMDSPVQQKKISDAVKELKTFQSIQTPDRENLTEMYEIVKPIYEAEYKETIKEILRTKISLQKSNIDDGFYDEKTYTNQSLNKIRDLLNETNKSMENSNLMKLTTDIETIGNASILFLRYNTKKLEKLLEKAEEKNISDYKANSALAEFITVKEESEKWIKTAKQKKTLDNNTKPLFEKLKKAINSLERKDGKLEEKITENYEDKEKENDAVYLVNIDLKNDTGKSDSLYKEFLNTKVKYEISNNGKTKKLYIDLKPIYNNGEIEQLVKSLSYTGKSNVFGSADVIKKELVNIWNKKIDTPTQIVLDVDGQTESIPVQIDYYYKDGSIKTTSFEKLIVDYDSKEDYLEEPNKPSDKTELNKKLKEAKNKYNKWVLSEKYTDKSLDAINNIIIEIENVISQDLSKEQIDAFIIKLSELEGKLVQKSETQVSKTYTVNVRFLKEDASGDSHASTTLVSRAKLTTDKDGNFLTLKLNPMYNSDSQPTGVISKLYYYKDNDKNSNKMDVEVLKQSKITMSHESFTKEYTYPSKVKIPVDGTTKDLHIYSESASPVFKEEVHGHNILLRIDYDGKSEGYSENEVDKKELIALINSVNEKYYSSWKNIMSDKAYTALINNLKKAKEVRNKIDSTEQDVKSAFNNLASAKLLADLYITSENTKNQTEADLKSDELSGKFTSESINNAKKYIKNQREEILNALGESKVDAEKVNKLNAQLLSETIKHLRYDVSVLEAKIKSAEEKINSGEYKENSVEDLKAEVKKSKEYVERAKKEKGIDERSKYEKAIEASEKLLIKKEEVPNLNKKPLEDKIETAKKIKIGNKTDKAFATLRSAIEKAVSKLNSATKNSEIEAAVKELDTAINTFNSSEDKKQEEKLNEIKSEIKTKDGKISMANDFLLNKSIKAMYNKEKNESTYELTFKKYDGPQKRAALSESKSSVSRLWYLDGKDYKEASLIKSEDGNNTFKFSKSGKIEKEIGIKIFIPAMNSEQEAKLLLNLKEDKVKEFKSIEGKNRYATAAKISEVLFPKTNDKAVIASGVTPVDALATSTYAKSINAPILLANKKGIPTETLDEIRRLGVKEVSIVGGYSTIGKDVDEKLKTMGIDVVRIYGSNRYKTAQKLLQKSSLKSKKYVVVNGINYADAISISGYCAQNNFGMILSDGISIDDKDMDLIKNADEVIIIGGTSSISRNIENKISKIVKNTSRISGKDRYETSLKISERLYKEINSILISAGTDEKVIDALSGSQLAAGKKAPIQLVGNNISEGQKEYIKSKNIKDTIILGGKSSVSETIRNIIKSL